jgi:hypothetical protein
MLGLQFDKALREPFARTHRGELVYSVGVVSARWFPNLKSGAKLKIPLKTNYTTFLVIVSDAFDVIIGRPSIVSSGIYYNKPGLLQPL